MPTLTYEYVYFATGSHRRQPRATIGPGGFTLLKSIPGGSPASGGTFVAGAQPQTLTVSSATYTFAFTSVTGGTPAGQTSTESGTPPASVTVGSDPIVVLVVYLPPGGPSDPGEGSGATIDAFDETKGALFDDTFVKVSPDANGSLTISANIYGYVDTTATAAEITVITPTSPSKVDFDKWVSLAPTGTQSSPTLPVKKGESVVALAFYKAPPPLPAAQVTCNQAVAGIDQIISLGPKGPLYPVADWTKIVASLKKCVQEGYLTQAFVDSLEARYLAYAKERGEQP